MAAGTEEESKVLGVLVLLLLLFLLRLEAAFVDELAFGHLGDALLFEFEARHEASAERVLVRRPWVVALLFPPIGHLRRLHHPDLADGAMSGVDAGKQLHGERAGGRTGGLIVRRGAS